MNSLARKAVWVLWLLVLPIAGQAGEYNPEHCSLVTGTLNIHWQGVAGVEPCTDIEFTDGQLADAADGSFTMQGISTTGSGCSGLAAYAFTLSEDGTALTGSDTVNNVPMTLVRGPGERCFVGHWTSLPFDYIATISGAAAGEIFYSGFED